jgi:hypothetical protein
VAQIAGWSPWPVGLTVLPFLGIVVFGVATAVDAIHLGLRGEPDDASEATLEAKEARASAPRLTPGLERGAVSPTRT